LFQHMKSLTHPHQKNHQHFYVSDFFSKLFSAAQPLEFEELSTKTEELTRTNGELKLSLQKLEIENQQLKSLCDETQSSCESLILQNHHKSEFLASIAHELKNQIGAIISLSEFIKSESGEKVSDSESVKEYATDIHNVASDMNELIHDLLDVGSLASGNFSIDLSKEIDITDVIKCLVPLNNGECSRNFNLSKINFQRVNFSEFKIHYRYINKEDLWCKFYMHAPRLRLQSEKKFSSLKRASMR